MEMYKNSNPFEVNMYVEKSYEDGANHVKKIRGVASGPKKDRQGHMFSFEGVKSIQKAIEEGHIDDDGDWSEIPLVYEHETKWDSEVGWVTKAEIDDDGQLWIEAELDDTSLKAMELYKRLNTPKRNGKMRQFGLSVKGQVTHYHKVWDEIQKSFVPVFNKMRLDEISVTSQPCYPADAYLAIAKSLNADSQEEVSEMTQESNKNVEKSIFNREPLKAEEVEAHDEVLAQVAEEQAEPEVVVSNDNNDEAVEVEDNTNEGSTTEENPTTEADTVNVAGEETAPIEEQHVERAGALADEKNEDAAPAGYAVHPLNTDEAFGEVEKSITNLASRLSKLEEAIDTLNVKESAPAGETAAEGETVEVQKSEQTSELERIESIVADAIGKIAGELEIVKSLVEEVSKDPSDKSINIVKSKSDATPQTPEEMRVKLIEEGMNPIRAAMVASGHFTSN